MKEKREFAFGVLIGLLIGIVMGIIIASSGCDPMDPQNSVNAIYLEDPTGTTGRFRTVYVNVVSGVELRVFEDIKYPGCELIMLAQSRGLGIAYVVHPVRDKEILYEQER